MRSEPPLVARSEPHRLALIGPLPPPAGGMANQTLQLARLLRDEGIEVEIVQVNAPYRPAWAGRLPGMRAVFRLAPYLWHLWRAAGRNQVFHVMANSGWSWHLFAAPAIWIAHLRGTPAVVNYRGGEAGTFLQKAAGIVRFSMRRAAALVTPSGFLQEVFAGFGMTARIVPNIIDLEKFRPGEGDSTEVHVLVARNLEPIYDLPSALRAFALLVQRHPGARMSVAGSGPERANLEQLARELGIGEQVRFTGRLDSVEMAALYRQASLCLNPSLADNMPNSVLEALACGLPVVSTNVGGVPYLVRHEHTALLVEPGDAQGMALALTRLIEDASLRTRLKDNGTEEVRAYTWARVREQWLSLYREVSA